MVGKPLTVWIAYSWKREHWARKHEVLVLVVTTQTANFGPEILHYSSFRGS